MQKEISIKIKAALLLIVFSLNILIGFACVLGLNMGFNNKRHCENRTSVDVVSHSGATSCVHPGAGAKDHSSKSEKDNCCHDKVVKFSEVDKIVTPHTNFIVNPAFFVPLLSSYYDIDQLNISQVTISIRHFIRSYHPPISDIRIEIQSFQV